MEITLEKIELVKDRTGASYKEAKEALEAADGSVVDAIISIEATIDEAYKEKKSLNEQGVAIADKIKEIVKKGNVSRIIVRKDDNILLSLPINAGIVGAILAPWGAVAGVVASFGFKCVIEIVKTDGTVLDISDQVKDKAQFAREKGEEAYNVAREKGEEAYNVAREKANETISKVKEMNEERKEKAFEDIDFSSCFDDESGFGIDDTTEEIEKDEKKED